MNAERRLSDEEIDRIADRLAEKLRAPKPAAPPPKPARQFRNRAEAHEHVARLLRRKGYGPRP